MAAKGNTNKYGLTRHIPADIKHAIRKACKFGCVICRSGFYQYEHIDDFINVRAHDVDRICCLCPSCHSQVTLKQLSKKTVEHHYEIVRKQSPENVQPPHGPLDFFDGTAELEIGGLQYSPLVNRVLTYHNVDLFSVYPGRNGEPGSISATFCDEKGRIVFRLEKNEWIGAPTNWDIRIVANRISVTSPSGREVLRIRLDPPGRIVVEWLDMRFHDAHILVSEHSYAAGRIPAYGNLVSWVFAKLQITKTTPAGACIEYLSLEQMNARISYLQGVGKSLATADGETIIGSPLGAIARAAGISIGHGTNFNLFGLGRISMPVEKMTKLVRDDPEGLVAAFKR